MPDEHRKNSRPAAGNASLKRRYLLASGVPLVLLALVLALLIGYLGEQLRSANREVEGSSALHTLVRAEIHLLRIRGLSQIALARYDAALAAEIRSRQDRFWALFADPVWDSAQEELSLAPSVHDLFASVRELFSVDLLAPGNRKDTLFDEFSQAAGELQRLIKLAADQSGLILNRTMDGYYLVDMAVNQLPPLMDAVGQVRGLGSGVMADGVVSDRERGRIEEQIAAIRIHTQGMKRDRDVIRSAAPAVAAALDDPILHFDEDMGGFEPHYAALVRQELPAMDPLQFFALGSRAIAALEDAYHQAEGQLAERIHDQQAGLRRGLILAILAATLGLSGMLAFTFSFYRREQQAMAYAQQLSRTDQLTDLPNRRALYEVFPREINRMRRAGQGMAFGMLDVDCFKAYNDNYGHQAGDQALQAVAETLRLGLRRAGDFVCRLGGEEFAFFFPADTQDQALGVAEALRRAVEEKAVPHKACSVSDCLTVSVGLVFVADAGAAELESALRASDRALYEAKQDGRNRCRAATTPL